jgi:hypothetical protein
MSRLPVGRTSVATLLLALSLTTLPACREREGAALPTPADPAPGWLPAAVPATTSRRPLAAPQVIALEPPAGATDVDPQRTTLAVTFDREMDPEGWAWVVESPLTAPQIGESRWDDALRVNTAEVVLAPGRNYVVWLNSATHPYFRDRAGRALEPVRWTFSTAPETAAFPALSAHSSPP